MSVLLSELLRVLEREVVVWVALVTLGGSYDQLEQSDQRRQRYYVNEPYWKEYYSTR